jgi:hypothetical protein
MPDKTQDIQAAIEEVVAPGDEITLAELDTRLYEAYPVLKDEDRRWIGVALSKMLRDGRLVAAEPDRAYADDYVVRRPADG